MRHDEKKIYPFLMKHTRSRSYAAHSPLRQYRLGLYALVCIIVLAGEWLQWSYAASQWRADSGSLRVLVAAGAYVPMRSADPERPQWLQRLGVFWSDTLLSRAWKSLGGGAFDGVIWVGGYVASGNAPDAALDAESRQYYLETDSHVSPSSPNRPIPEDSSEHIAQPADEVVQNEPEAVALEPETLHAKVEDETPVIEEPEAPLADLIDEVIAAEVPEIPARARLERRGLTFSASSVEPTRVQRGVLQDNQAVLRNSAQSTSQEIDASLSGGSQARDSKKLSDTTPHSGRKPVPGRTDVVSSPEWTNAAPSDMEILHWTACESCDTKLLGKRGNTHIKRAAPRDMSSLSKWSNAASRFFALTETSTRDIVYAPGLWDAANAAMNASAAVAARARFEATFGPVAGLVVWNNWNIVWIDSAGLSAGGAETVGRGARLARVARDTVTKLAAQRIEGRPTVLVSHLPLFRRGGACQGGSSVVTSEEGLGEGGETVGGSFRGPAAPVPFSLLQNALTPYSPPFFDEATSSFLLQTLQPSLVYSTAREWCSFDHEIGEGRTARETSVKGIASAGTRKPGFHVLELGETGAYLTNVDLPSQVLTYTHVYLPAAFALLFACLFVHIYAHGKASRALPRSLSTRASDDEPLGGLGDDDYDPRMGLLPTQNPLMSVHLQTGMYDMPYDSDDELDSTVSHVRPTERYTHRRRTSRVHQKNASRSSVLRRLIGYLSTPVDGRKLSKKSRTHFRSRSLALARHPGLVLPALALWMRLMIIGAGVFVFANVWDRVF